MDVRALVLDAIDLIHYAQRELQLTICSNIRTTRNKLESGRFIAQQLPRNRTGTYHMVYGTFEPPSTIILDSKLPFCDHPLDIPEIPHTMSYYTATHEVIHADDHIGGDLTYLATHEHILRNHGDQLKESMKIIRVNGNDDCIQDEYDLACMWAIQYVDILTHYRSYVVLRHHGFPKLDMVWDLMQTEIFPPSMMTTIEDSRDMQYIFKTMIENAGNYCLIDAIQENQIIDAKRSESYTV